MKLTRRSEKLMTTIGKFYKEKVLSLPKEKLTKKELPSCWIDEPKIVRDLFGWKIFTGKEYIECSSEEEARYLKIFLETGIWEVYVPDLENLRILIPELEKIKKRIDDIINRYLIGILDKDLRRKIKQEVYAYVTKFDGEKCQIKGKKRNRK
jgi:hypothetical protein